MQETLNGYKKRGSWTDIVEHGERITAALDQLDIDPDRYSDWEDWRPKADERLRKDVNTKTADQAAIQEGNGEKDGKHPNDDLKKAGKKLSDSGVSDTPGDAAKDVQKSLSYAARAVDTVSRKAFRTVEKTVYKHVMTKMAPYYFDNELISANATRITKLTNQTIEFELEVNINDDEIREELDEIVLDLEKLERWHGETPKNLDTAIDAEGQDPVDTPPNQNAEQLLKN